MASSSWGLGGGLVLVAVIVGVVGVFGRPIGVLIAAAAGLALVLVGAATLRATSKGRLPWASWWYSLPVAFLLGLVLFSGGTAAAWGALLVMEGDARGYVALPLGILGAGTIAILVVLLLANDVNGVNDAPGGGEPRLPG